MSHPSTVDTIGRRYALCIGIGQYTTLANRNLRYAGADAKAVAERLKDPQRGNFEVTLLIELVQTSKTLLDDALDQILNAPDRKAEDLVVIYFSCHGEVYDPDKTFCLLPSNATLQVDGTFKRTTVIGIYDLTKMLSGAKVHNIIVLLDVCHSGGAGVVLQHLKLDLSSGPNLFIIGAARQDQAAMQSSQLQHGIFTHCLLRAFEQPPTKDGWLSISQIQSFVSDEIHWFAKDHPIQIQGWSVSVNPNLPLLRNPAYPELCPLPPLWNVPLQRNSFFTGQDDLLVRLATILQSDQKTALTQPQAITGLGGIGKTQLALEYAYRHRQDYHAVLWSRADTREALISTFVTIAHLLDLPQKDEQDQLIAVEAVKTWLAGRSKWLLVLDNADELAMVKEFIPPAFQGHLLLTTRAQVTGGLARKIEVETMRPETGALLLLRRAHLIAPDAPLEKASPADVTVAKELSEEMGGLPLALDQAGAYIEEVSCSTQDYQRLYQVRRTELLKERRGVVPDHPESVATTWSLAFQKVEQGNPAASDLLRLCAFLHPDAIPEEMIAKGAEHLGPQLQAMASDPLALNKAITALRAYSLLHRDSTTHTLTIHRLVQAVLKASLDEAMRQHWAERTVRAVNRTFSSIETWQQRQLYLPHAQVCVGLIEQWQMTFAEATQLLYHIGCHFLELGDYYQAEQPFAQALAMREQTLGAEHSDAIRCLSKIVDLYYYQARYTEAIAHGERLLALRRQTLSPEHPDIAQSLNDLGSFYHALGEYSQAESLLTQAVRMRDQVLEPGHLDQAESLNNLASLYTDQGKYDHAELLFKRALAIHEQTLGSTHPYVAFDLLNLAQLYSDRRDYTRAEPLLKRALALRERALGSDHPDVAQCLNSLALLYYEQGNYGLAEPLCERALTIRQQMLKPEHPDVAQSLNVLGLLYHVKKEFAQAEELFLRALAIREQALGPRHAKVALTLTDLASLYTDQKRYPEAKSLFTRAIAIYEQTPGPQHPDAAKALEQYASLLGRMNGENEAGM